MVMTPEQARRYFLAVQSGSKSRIVQERIQIAREQAAPPPLMGPIKPTTSKAAPPPLMGPIKPTTSKAAPPPLMGPVKPEPDPTPFKSSVFTKSPIYAKVKESQRRIELARRYKQKQVVGLTPQQYQQQTYTAMKDIGRQKSEYYRMVGGIDPTTTYKYKGATVPGALLKAKLEKEYLPQFERAEKISQTSWSAARDIEKEAHPDTRFIKTDIGYDIKFPFAGAEKYRTHKKTLKRGGPILGFATALTGADPLGLKSAYYTATGQKEKVIQTKIEALHGVGEAKKGGWKAAEWYLSMPTTQIGLAAIGGEVIGAGTGAVQATSWGTKALFVSRGVTSVGKPLYTITASTLLKTGIGVGFGGMAIKETAPIVFKAFDTGDWSDVVSTGGVAALSLTAGISGYKKGYGTGFGRTESYLYGKAAYKPGSSEYIRFKSALKVARKLEGIKSHKAKPLDIAKDIMRLDTKSAKATIKFLEKHPKTTIGGSAASYTQIEGARSPRDIDLLLKGGDKEIASAKKWFGSKLLKTKEGQHRIDIHGTEMFKPGRHVEFGFSSKTPRKISGTRYLKPGEQVFRKAISSVKTETQYRRFKDLPDFITHSRSLIKSAKMKLLTKGRGLSAEKHLETFLHPEKHISYGKSDIYTKVFGKPKLTTKQRVIPLSKSGYTPLEQVYYRYPGAKSVFPGYYGYISKKTSYPAYSSYFPSKTPGYPSYKTLKTTPTILKTPSHPPYKTPKKTVPYAPPPLSETKILFPPYVSPGKTTKQSFKPHRVKKPRWEGYPGRRKKQKGIPKTTKPEYKFRMFDIGDLFSSSKKKKMFSSSKKKKKKKGVF